MRIGRWTYCIISVVLLASISAFAMDTDLAAEDTRLKVRLGIKGPQNFNREILLTFDKRATDNFDKGFDVHMFTDFPNDVYWVQGENHLVIQATDFMYPSREFPLGIKSDGSGPISIKVDRLENPSPYMEVYIRDNETLETFDILTDSFEVELEEGEHNDRYTLVFERGVEVSDVVSLPYDTPFKTMYKDTRLFINSTESLMSIRKPEDLNIVNVQIYNMFGQPVESWDTTIRGGSVDLNLNILPGVYIVRMETDKGSMSKKIIIRP